MVISVDCWTSSSPEVRHQSISAVLRDGAKDSQAGEFVD